MLAEKFFVDIANCILKDNIHPVFWQYTVICCAFMRFVCKYGGKVREIYSFFKRWQKEGREKLFPHFGRRGVTAKCGMCFFLCDGLTQVFCKSKR